MSKRTTPVTVTIKGRLFTSLGMIRVGEAKTNFEKNHPETIVPRDSRMRAFVRLEFSSLTGVRGWTVGLERKQNRIIRNL